ncbi:hypothetical protein JAAARDRAFT_191121 [Jaapia argillacea MUCL 33604]|uniref:Ubiquitin carboxyl-terminal hydrolase n=1 Tax=Jaapia argillacea MUCL 33604 TaxID=933084 RepID=A0A067Q1R4_9AGAM|nr:hypothetical protein JAAARDRAFT_191121 [Jaapia argillacea MUCL 33604]
MPPKRRRRPSPAPTGTIVGEKLKRAKVIASEYSAWGWVGTDVKDVSAISRDHRLSTCGLSKRNHAPFCANVYAPAPIPSNDQVNPPAAQGELDEDVIVISDDEAPQCSKKVCKSNPNCLNYLGQEEWVDEEEARAAFIKGANLGDDPTHDFREDGSPVGLKNLGATCYANAFLQVWFQDMAFRDGVYKCQPSPGREAGFDDSPVFQLQVTFTALQESVQGVFNPSKLVESLRLRTSEQQDAQEFSKLFMSHLDTEFRKQEDTGLKTLIPDQFQGKQVYGTLCSNCHNRSERLSDFLEIEINIENNAKLEDRISALLQPEPLSGDNQYYCSSCDSLQDATRYTELRELPPVLHFSLLRFVFDVSSMQRKKSKHAISFPTLIDMGQFLGPDDTHNEQRSNGTCSRSGHVYELRGVLLHKGQSAYHGHYEAQVFDVLNKQWYQFNDETVTKIKVLGSAPLKSKGHIEVIDVDGDPRSRAGPSRPRVRKKRRVYDSDDEGADASPPTESKPEQINYVSSKDAYMLIYARRDTSSGSTYSAPDAMATPLAVASSPPSRALEVIRASDSRLYEVMGEFAEKRRQAIRRFYEIRSKVIPIYQTWHVSSEDQKCLVVSRQALQRWLSGCLHGFKCDKKSDGVEPGESCIGVDEPLPGSSFDPAAHIIDVSEIVCSHGRLSPKHSSDMKRIEYRAYQLLVAETKCSFSPLLTPDDVCEICVADEFTERFYQYQHPRLVASFDKVCDGDAEAPGY